LLPAGFPAFDVSRLVAWTLPFAVTLYLGVQNGGYGPIVRGQVGIVLWWMLFVGALAGVSRASISRAGWIVLGLFVAFLSWGALSLTWTESAERTVVEVARIGTYLAVLIVGLQLAARAGARPIVNGLACAVVLIGFLAVMSRIHPAWFPERPEFGDQRRLSYPINYWNGLGGLMAMGVPLLLGIAGSGRNLLGRSAAAAVLPVLALCVTLTVSRGGMAACAIGVVAFLVLARDRIMHLVAVAVAMTGSAIVVAIALARPEFRDGLTNSAADHQASQVLAALVLVCLGVASLQLAVSLVERHVERPAWLAPSRSRTFVGTGVALVLAIVVALAAGAPSAVDRGWSEFKEPKAAASVAQDTTFARLGSASGNGRYQYWQAAVKAQESKPLLGRGAGTYEYWWARTRGEAGGFVRDAHSLYMQTFAELGPIGLALIVAFLGALFVTGIRRCWRSFDEERVLVAAATASIAAFTTIALVEWVWQLAVLPVMLMLLAGVVLRGHPATAPHAERGGWRFPAAVIALAVVCIPVLTVVGSGASQVAESQASAAKNDSALAIDRARSAIRLEPYAAGPRMQDALLLEQQGALDEAAVSISLATQREPTNWRPWLIRARIDAERGRTAAAVAAYERARRLNPRSSIFSSTR